MTCLLLRLPLRSSAARCSILVQECCSDQNTRYSLPRLHPSSHLRTYYGYLCYSVLQFDCKLPNRGPAGRTSTSFLLRASLALSSIGVNPAIFAHSCVLLVLLMPGVLGSIIP